MLTLKPNCECCDRDLPADSVEARICTFECTFCEDCAQKRFLGVCPNCGGNLVARPLRPVWPLVEEHADRLDRLARQQTRVAFEVGPGREGMALAVTVPLADPGQAVRILLEGKEVRYYLVREGELLAADLRETRVDQGLYLLLAELASHG